LIAVGYNGRESNMASIGKLPTGRWQARWRDPDGNQRRKAFTRKTDAERFLINIEADKLRGTYIDPDAGRVTFADYAAGWLAAQTFDRSTYQATELRIRLHVNPVLGAKELRNIRPSGIQAWVRSMSKLAATYQRTIFSNVSTIFAAAVDDEVIAKNPCSAPSVRKPRADQRHVIPWETKQVKAVRDALPQRYRIVAVVAAGLGLRQGEVFGLSPDDVDFLRGKVEVRRQVKLYANGQQAFALPKGRKTRTVPLPPSVRDELAAYLAKYPVRNVTMPWGDLGASEISVPLIVTSRESKAINRNYFNQFIWKAALKRAGVPPTRDNGMHALRHAFGSVLIDGGESIKAVSEYLGHASPAFTMSVYVHVMHASADRSKKAIDAMWFDDDSDSRSPSVLEASE